jgi:hypothetical protein
MSFRHVVPNSGTPFTASSLGPAAYMQPMYCEYGPEVYSHPPATASQYPTSYYSLPPQTGSYMYHEVPHTASILNNLQYAMPYNYARGLKEAKIISDESSNGYRAVNLLSNLATGAMGYVGARYMQAGITDHVFDDGVKKSRP